MYILTVLKFGAIKRNKRTPELTGVFWQERLACKSHLLISAACKMATTKHEVDWGFQKAQPCWQVRVLASCENSDAGDMSLYLHVVSFRQVCTLPPSSEPALWSSSCTAGQGLKEHEETDYTKIYQENVCLLYLPFTAKHVGCLIDVETGVPRAWTPLSPGKTI